MKEVSQRHMRLMFASEDLFRCKDYLVVLSESKGRGAPGSKENTVYEALVSAAVVAYCRAFGKSFALNQELNRPTKLYFDSFVEGALTDLSKQQQDLHSNMIYLRDTVFAHTDESSSGPMAFGSNYIMVNPLAGFDQVWVGEVRGLVAALHEAVLVEQQRVAINADHKR